MLERVTTKNPQGLICFRIYNILSFVATMIIEVSHLSIQQTAHNFEKFCSVFEKSFLKLTLNQKSTKGHNSGHIGYLFSGGRSVCPWGIPIVKGANYLERVFSARSISSKLRDNLLQGLKEMEQEGRKGFLSKQQISPVTW